MARQYAEDHFEEEPDDGQLQSLDDCPFTGWLLWYKNVSRNVNKLQLSCEQWMESLDSLVHVTVEVAKNRPGLHQLCISLPQIHKVVFAGQVSKNFSARSVAWILV